MAGQNTVNPSTQPAGSTQQAKPTPMYQLRKNAIASCAAVEIGHLENAVQVMSTFVLNEDNAAFVWSAARVAHTAAGFTTDDFRDSLRKKDTLQDSEWICHDSHDFNKDPYQQLGLQEWIKYLYYGGQRRQRDADGKVLRNQQGEILNENDQDLVLNYFGCYVDYKLVEVTDKKTLTTKKQRQLNTNYSWCFYPVMQLRNQLSAHRNVERKKALTLDTVMNSYSALTTCLKPLAKTGWLNQDKAQALLAQLEKDFFTALGKVSYRVEDIMVLADIDAANQAKVEALLVSGNVQVTGGMISISGEVLDFVEVLRTAWRYYQLMEVAGKDQLKKGMEKLQGAIDPQAASTTAPADKSAAALKDGGAADWTELGDRFRLGIKGAWHDEAEAMVWYEKAATATSPNLRAMYELGRLCEPTDPLKALGYYRSAANLGYAPAQVCMGIHCENGTCGQPRNWAEAVAWYSKAAQQNDPDGLFRLGYCYESGQGVEKNYQQAASYYLQALKNSDEAKVRLARLQLYGYGVPRNEAEAIATLRHLAQQNFAPALAQLGICYLFGYGVEKAPSIGVDYIEQAAVAGDRRGQYLLGYCYEKGFVEEEKWTFQNAFVLASKGAEPRSAIGWYNTAAKQGYVAAQLQCANMCWLEDLSNQGYLPAKEKLAEIYMTGDEQGTNKNLVAAVELLQVASQQGSYSAKLSLAKCYMEGIGVPKDAEKARTLAEAAADHAPSSVAVDATMLLSEWCQSCKLQDIDTEYLQRLPALKRMCDMTSRFDVGSDL